MARKNTVKMGSLNLLILVIAICLALLSVLSITTARAQSNLTERESLTVQETYAEECAAQYFLSCIDADLAPLRQGVIPSSRVLPTLGMMVRQYADQAVALPSVEGNGITVEAQVLSQEAMMAELRLDHVTYDAEGEDWVIDLGVEEDLSGEMPFYGSLPYEEIIIGGIQTEPEDDESSEGDEGATESEDDQDGWVPLFGLEQTTESEEDSAGSAHLENVGLTCIGGVQLQLESQTGRLLDCIIGIRDDGTYVVLQWKALRIRGFEAEETTLWMGD